MPVVENLRYSVVVFEAQMALVSCPQLLARRWLTLAAGLWMQVRLFHLNTNSLRLFVWL
jgi:hypothetical protein